MINKALGERIRELRYAKCLSQEEFAKCIGMDRSYYATIESGKRNISLKLIERIASGLGVSISFLFQGIDERIHTHSEL
jgi:transcriptional regulator with XRE-family HTH domain